MISAEKSMKNVWNEQKKVENDPEKLLQPAFGCAHHPKAGQNTQQQWYKCFDIKKVKLSVDLTIIFYTIIKKIYKDFEMWCKK